MGTPLFHHCLMLPLNSEPDTDLSWNRYTEELDMVGQSREEETVASVWKFLCQRELPNSTEAKRTEGRTLLRHWRRPQGVPFGAGF